MKKSIQIGDIIKWHTSKGLRIGKVSLIDNNGDFVCYSIVNSDFDTIHPRNGGLVIQKNDAIIVHSF